MIKDKISPNSLIIKCNLKPKYHPKELLPQLAKSLNTRFRFALSFKVPDRGLVNPSPSGDRVMIEAADTGLQQVASSGNVTDKIWQEYIENQKPDDDFKVL